MTFVFLAITICLPVGVVVGRTVWRVLFDRMGVSARPAVPVGLIITVVPVGPSVAALAAALPGWLAARTHPADALRSK